MFTPAQKAVLQKVTGDPAAFAASVLAMPLKEIQDFIAEGDRFVTQNARLLRSTSFGFALSADTVGTQAVTANIIKRECRSSRSVLVVDRHLRYVNALPGRALMTESFQRTAASNTLELLYWGPTAAYVIVGGELVSERRLGTSSLDPPVPSGWERPMSEFDQILADHVEHHIKDERGVRYWSDKRNRVLLSTPDGTERIFHLSLFWWLKHFVSDGLRVFAETRGLGQDATDITIVTMSGDFVVEVKWLGRNDANTGYQHPPRVDEGLQQVRIYLENDPNLVRGFLVVYDGRPAVEHRGQSVWNPVARHERCCEPKLVFLESETPSQVARRAARA